MRIDSEAPYYRWKLHSPLDGCDTIFALAKKGCPKCGRRLQAEGSTGFGCSLHCKEHKCIWIFMPSRRGHFDGYAPKQWKNMVTGETSKEWKYG